MKSLLHIGICIALAFTGLCGCKPFQSGSLGRLQQPLLNSDEEDYARSASRGSRMANSPVRPTATSVQHSLGDSASASSRSDSDALHSSQGYCEACGVTHGSSTGIPAFKFTRPLPEFKAASTDSGSDEAAVQPQQENPLGSNLSPTRVRPLQPEEARSEETYTSSTNKAGLDSTQAETKAAPPARPAPPPQPDDSIEPSAATSSASLTSPLIVDPAVVPAMLVSGDKSTGNPEVTPANTKPAAAPTPDEAPEAQTSNSESPEQGSAEIALTASASPSAIDLRSAEMPRASEQAAAVPQSTPSEQFTALQTTLRSLREQAALNQSATWSEALDSELTALELLAQRVEELAAGGTEPTDEQMLCKHQLAALVATLRPDSLDISRPEGRQTATATLEHLREAIAQLEPLVSLKVSAGSLCSEVRGFGQYKPFESDEFRTGQPCLLYCELQNFCSSETLSENSEPGYRTRLKSSLVICREDGSVAQQAEFPVVEDLARNRRHDFYLYVPFTIGELAPGKYRVHLVVDDLLGRKQAVLDPPVEFKVR